MLVDGVVNRTDCSALARVWLQLTLFALLNLGLADAGILCWWCKFTHDFWRPVTAIQLSDETGNPERPGDPGWMPLLATPPFPSYTSGHSTFSAAAASVLAKFFGNDQIAFESASEGLPGSTRTFPSFSVAAREAVEARHDPLGSPIGPVRKAPRMRWA